MNSEGGVRRDDGREYREWCFEVVEQEADETLYWLEIIRECDWIKHELVDSLIIEADELVAIFTTIGKKSKK